MNHTLISVTPSMGIHLGLSRDKILPIKIKKAATNLRAIEIPRRTLHIMGIRMSRMNCWIHPCIDTKAPTDH